MMMAEPMVNRTFEVTTETGSVYTFGYDQGSWTVVPDNVPNHSMPVLEGVFAIERPYPFPFREGHSVIIQAHNSVALDDPMRFPRGAITTSRVVKVEEL
jgi:hypothetical protein